MRFVMPHLATGASRPRTATGASRLPAVTKEVRPCCAS
jgi:hypothetical protein